MGKSTTLCAEHENLRRTLKPPDRSMFLDLGAYSTDLGLKDALFRSPEYLDWLRNSYRLHLFLDSLDECRTQISGVVKLLIAGFEGAPAERLFLRIACRTAGWPNDLESWFRKNWGESKVGVYELAPLRRIDVVSEAGDAGLVPDRFLDEVGLRDAAPFANRPITLKFLLNSYRKNGAFPATRADLYEEGCLCLCEEPAENRRESPQECALTAAQRMAVASRIAAVTVFGNHSAISKAPRSDQPAYMDIHVDDLVGGTEPAENPVPVTAQAICETLDTGLFSARGPQRLGWSHQSYAEFLAARYLTQHKIAPGQMLALVMHPEDPGKVAPQLHETAAWLAGMVPEVYRAIVRSDPETLLSSDNAAAGPADREALVRALLESCERREWFDSDWGLYRAYRKLGYPGIASVLKPFVVDKSKDIVARRVAMEIAEANDVRDLEDDLLSVALDASDLYQAKVYAAGTISTIGSPEAKAKLKPLALGEAGNDPDDELKGCALRAVWPDSMSAAELFSCLTPLKNPNLIGAYHVFLREEVVAHLKSEDLPFALDWARDQVTGFSDPDLLCELPERLLLEGLGHLAVTGVVERLANVIRELLRNSDTLSGHGWQNSLRERFSRNRHARCALLRALLPVFGWGDTDLVLLPVSGLVEQEDLKWLVEELESGVPEQVQQVLARLIGRMLVPGDVEGLDLVFMAAQRNAYLKHEVDPLLGPVELGSPRAFEMKEQYRQHQELENGQETRPLDPPPQVRIANRLAGFESGKIDEFINLNFEMTLKPDSTHYEFPFDQDLTALPGWSGSSNATRNRIVAAAKRYLEEFDPRTDTWLGTDRIPHAAAAGCNALRFSLKTDPQFLETAPQCMWQKWGPVALAVPLRWSDEDRAVIGIAFRKAPAGMIRTLRHLIHAGNEGRPSDLVLPRIESVWNSEIESALVEELTDEGLPPAVLGSILATLLKHRSQRAEEIARSWVDPGQPDGRSRAKAIAAAVKLMEISDDAGWDVIWPAIQRDAGFGVEVLSDVSSSPESGFGRNLTEPQLGDLLIWLSRNAPSAARAAPEVVDRILNLLVSRGTFAACSEIRRAMSELPGHEWLNYCLVKAKEEALRQTWAPVPAKAILKIAGDAGARLVRNGEQLVQVLVESLDRLQAKLQGETPAAVDLWDESVFRPKDEMRLSDYLKRHFETDVRDRGIVANREVQIRRGAGGAPGERTDLHIDAVTQGQANAGFGSAAAVVEVKGCWNDGVLTDMKSQLADRYLRDNPCRHGLYVVGWYNCRQWDDSDPRKGKAGRFATIERLRGQLEEQAADLSTGDRRIRAFVLNIAPR